MKTIIFAYKLFLTKYPKLLIIGKIYLGYKLSTYKRSIFVINPQFQYKFSIFICSFAFIGSLIYPYTIYELFEKINALQPGGLVEIENNRNQLLLILTLIQFAYLGIVFVTSIFLSHKVAGPMYKLQNFLKDIRAGKEYRPVSFRAGDNFPEIADEINLTIEYFINQRQVDFQYINEVQSYISNLALVVPEDKKPVLEEILSKLTTIQNRN